MAQSDESEEWTLRGLLKRSQLFGWGPIGYSGTRLDWVVVTARNRGCDPSDNYQFARELKALGGEGEFVAVERFNHWGFGWLELILANVQDDKTFKKVNKLLAKRAPEKS